MHLSSTPNVVLSSSSRVYCRFAASLGGLRDIVLAFKGIRRQAPLMLCQRALEDINEGRIASRRRCRLVCHCHESAHRTNRLAYVEYCIVSNGTAVSVQVGHPSCCQLSTFDFRASTSILEEDIHSPSHDNPLSLLNVHLELARALSEPSLP